MNRKKQELTFTSVLLGIILAAVFGGANAYLGLRVGMTVSASVPAAVIAMGIIRFVLRKNSRLETNIVQTIGSAGESVAAGAIFTIPALFIWANEWRSTPPSLPEITCITMAGGMLGVFFMVPLRKALIVREHKTLGYPEGTACARVIAAGENSGSRASLVFAGLGLSAVYKFITDGLKVFPSKVHKEFRLYQGAGIGVDVLPALAGVGYICGIRIASYMLSGGILAWLVLMPVIAMFGGDAVIYPGTDTIRDMSSNELWSNYIRYVGAGAVAAAGIISLIKTFPLIVQTVLANLRSREKEIGIEDSTQKDLPMPVVIGGIAITGLAVWLLPVIPVNFSTACLIVLFGFFFATVSARMVGLVGSSNNPVSGMTIATLLISVLLLKTAGNNGRDGMIMAIVIGSVICIIASVAGDTSQDLKAGYLLGATPVKQQIGEIIGVVVSSFTIGAVLYLLNTAWGYGSAQLPAPQAMLMKMVVEGVMDGNLPWNLIFTGVFLTLVLELLGLPVLPVAIGIYLPVHLSVPVMAGGMIRFLVEKRKEKAGEECVERGILFSSGMIAGEGLVGIVLAVLAVVPAGNKTAGEVLDISRSIYLGQTGALILFLLLLGVMFFSAVHKNKKEGMEAL